MTRPKRLAKHGYDPKMGARPMARLIQKHIKQPLAEQMLFGELAEHGGHVQITIRDDEPALNISANTAPQEALPEH